MVRKIDTNDGETTDSCDEKEKQDDKTTLNCSHIMKSVDPTKLKKALKASGILRTCRECDKEPPNCNQPDDDDGDMFEYDNNLWLCLKCGAQLCGRRKNKHALWHYNVSFK